jgi:hypothetical protein
MTGAELLQRPPGDRVGGPESVDLLSGCRSTHSFFVVWIDTRNARPWEGADGVVRRFTIDVDAVPD